ncbi:MAG: DUF3472 domain-containing protein [Candidatus Bathyarchaeia archaeon]
MRDKRLPLTLAGFLIILLLIALMPAFANSSPDLFHVEHFSTLAPDTDVQLKWPLNNSYSMSMDLKVVQSPESQATIFWGHQFTFMNGERGYIGFGIGGNVKIATVAVFDAVSGNPYNSTGGCDIGVPFSTTGNGWQCFVVYKWKIGFNYRLQFSKLSDVNGNEQWQGSVYDYATKSNSIIGSLLVSPAFGQLSSSSSTWDEYSTASSCDTTYTSAIFSSPYAMNSAGNHAPVKAQVTYGNSTCQDSNVQALGGGAYRADAGKNVTRTTPANTWLWTQEPTLVSQNSTSVPEFQLATLMAPLLISVSSVLSYFARSRRQSSKNSQP